MFEYRDNFRVRRNRQRFKRLKGKRTKVEVYIDKVKAGAGSRRFKEWLLSKPLDAYVIRMKGPKNT
jgi:hypothetical protein